MQRTLHHHTMVCPEWRFNNTRIFVPYLFLNVCCTIFGIFLLVAEALFSPAFCFSMTTAKKLKKRSCILPRSLLPGSGVLSIGQVNQPLQMAHFFKMQKPTSCGTTTWICPLLAKPLSPPPPPPDTHTHKHENDHFISLLQLHFLAWWFHHRRNRIIQSIWVW